MAGMFGGGAPPEQKGDISQLWKILGVEMYGDEIVWQKFNPEPKLGDIAPEFIFIDEGLTAHETPHPFNPEDEISRGMRQVLFLVAGAFRPANNSKLEFKELAVTGRNSGTISYQDFEMSIRSRGRMGVRRTTTREPYIVAARVTGDISEDELYLSNEDAKQGGDGKANDDPATADDDDASEAADGKQDDADPADDDALAGKEPEKTKIDAVLVADIDWIIPDIFRLREMGNDPDMVVDWNFQNVTLVLNILDALAEDDRFIELRKRTRPHRILTKVEEATETYRDKSLEEQTKFANDARQQIEKANEDFRTKMAELEQRKDLDPRAMMQIMERERIRLERLRDVQITRLEAERERKVKQSEREQASHIRGVQDRYKMLAVFLPPIPPVLLALFVFFHRRKAEQEGVDTRRLRYGKMPEDAAA
jgi:ABC-2 type transport system permease protein